MSVLKIKDSNGNWIDIPAIKGEQGPAGERGPQGIQGETGATGPAGRDGYVQYTAGENITIENNVISASGGSEYGPTNKLNADYVDDTNTTNKFTNATEKATWNAKSDFSGDYDDLTNKPDLSVYQTTIDSSHKLDADLVDDLTSNNKFQFIGKLSDLDNDGYLDLNLAKEGVYFADKVNGYNKFVRVINSSTISTSNLDFRINLLFVIKETSSIDLQSGGTIAYALGYQNTWGQAYFIKFYATVTGYIQEEHNIWAKDPYIYAMTNYNQQFFGTKQFHSIPEVYSYSAPTQNTQLTPKKYVDDQLATKTIQYSTMPTASSSLLDKIVEYIGTTDSSYTNGYFYKCIATTEDNTTTYSWERVDVQPGLPSDSYMTYINTGENTSSNIFVFENKKKGLYIINNTYNNKLFYYKVKESDNNISQYNGQPIYLYLFEDFDYDNAENNHIFGYLINIYGDNSMMFTKIKKSSTLISGGANICGLLSGSNQSIFGTKTFYSIPKQNNTNAPTNNAEFTNKKYVDDSINNAIGSINTILATLTTPSNNS